MPLGKINIELRQLKVIDSKARWKIFWHILGIWAWKVIPIRMSLIITFLVFIFLPLNPPPPHAPLITIPLIWLVCVLASFAIWITFKTPDGAKEPKDKTDAHWVGVKIKKKTRLCG